MLPSAVRALKAVRPAFVKKKGETTFFITQPVLQLLVVYRKSAGVIQRFTHYLTQVELLDLSTLI
jgi:hypothetical protein